MIDIAVIVEQLNSRKGAPITPLPVDPLEQFADGVVEYQPDGSYATVKGKDGAVLTVTPDGNYYVVYR